MRYVGIISVIACLVVAAGCRHYCCWGKRHSEQHCPTDVRKTHVWCFGEDAIFRWPCGPNSDFYGHKPTCWREWPASGSVWRDVHCGDPVPALIPCEEVVIMGTVPAPPPYPVPPASDYPSDGSRFREQPAAKPLQEPETLPLFEGASHRGGSRRLLPEVEAAVWQHTQPALRPYDLPPDAPIEDETSAALRHYLSVKPETAPLD